MIDATSIIEYTHDDFVNGCKKIVKQIKEVNYRPNYIVGVARGGAIPAVYLSHMLKIPVVMLHWSSRDSSSIIGNESNCWIPEDINLGKQILLVDDIVDGGETISQILDDWKSSVARKLVTANIKIAALHYNTAQDIKVDFYDEQIDRNVDSRWVVYPWESTS